MTIGSDFEDTRYSLFFENACINKTVRKESACACSPSQSRLLIADCRLPFLPIAILAEAP